MVDDQVEPDLQKTALNGSQIDSMVEIITQVVQGTIPRNSAIEMLATALQIGRDEAAKIVGVAGTSAFEGEEPPPGLPDAG
jgi:hypothetical protein